MTTTSPLFKKTKTLLNGTLIAIDFDGTCVTHEFPAVGKDIGAQQVLLELVEAGASLMLWTMRSDGREDGTTPLSDAVQWFESNGIPLVAVNENPMQSTWTSSPKLYAHMYIDDAALGAPLVYPEDGSRPYIDWQAVRQILLENE